MYFYLLFPLFIFGNTNSIFSYDEADYWIQSTILSGEEFYEPSIASEEDGLWLTWLEYIPGEGDHLWVGKIKNDKWLEKKRISQRPGFYKSPTLTIDGKGQMWLSYESKQSGVEQWDVYLKKYLGDGNYGPTIGVSRGVGNSINHCVAGKLEGGVYIAWQEDCNGQFDVIFRDIIHISGNNHLGKREVVSTSPFGDWNPSIEINYKGEVCIVWDTYNGESFDVIGRWRSDKKWGEITGIATGPQLQYKSQVFCDRRGNSWVLWEEGGRNWGHRYVGKSKKTNNISDNYGPLHRFRELHVALFNTSGTLQLFKNPFPMPSIDVARKRKYLRKDVEKLGVFYERGELITDSDGKLWVFYWHYFDTQCGLDVPTKHHIESGWKLYARYLDRDGWSKLYGFDIRQRDGMQRLSLARDNDKITAIWTTGRTDRRTDTGPRGLVVASITTPKGGSSPRAFLSPPEERKIEIKYHPITERKSKEVGGKIYHLCFGDLHRHTDLSLCRVTYDGSIQDAFRYAIEVAQLDFFGITDHARDIARGNPSSQLWWRSIKEDFRYRLKDSFFTYYSYERSHDKTADHNVISLRDNTLRNWPPPLPEFWKEIDGNTITIPHTPFRDRTWKYRDESKRPLLEIYQGARNYDSQHVAELAFKKGYHIGIIASSDHLSTSASYACVWTPSMDRVSIFRSMQARRTYGATDKIGLIFRSGEHWMGEQFTTSEIPEFQIEVEGTADIKSIQVFSDGLMVKSLPVSGSQISTIYKPEPELLEGREEQYFYIYIEQLDGNQAWSSPIWVRKIEAQ
jgi:hypothetical protein